MLRKGEGGTMPWVVRDAIDGVPEIELCTPREVELKGLRGSHMVYPVKLPI